MTTIVVVGLFWLLGPGLLTPLLFAGRDDEQDKLPSRFEHLRATSTYRRLRPAPIPRVAFGRAQGAVPPR